jgi:hypothetical protein
LIVLLENNAIVLPDDRKLMLELSTYECKISTSGNVIYNAPIGGKDDYVMSLAILVGQLYQDIEYEEEIEY